jgi:hypothetical protein
MLDIICSYYYLFLLLFEKYYDCVVRNCSRELEINRRELRFNELIHNYNFLFDTQIFNEETLYNRLNIYNGCEYEKNIKSEVEK